MLLMALFAVAPYTARLIDVFVLDRRIAPAARRRLYVRSETDRIARVVGVLLATGIIFWTFRVAETGVASRKAVAQAPLHGIWDIEEATRNGTPVPLMMSDDTVWTRIVFPLQGRAVVVSIWGTQLRYNARIDVAAKRIELTPWSAESVMPASVIGLSHQPPTEDRSFTFSLLDDDHLMLQEVGGDDPLVMRLRRFDLANYRLFRPRLQWYW